VKKGSVLGRIDATGEFVLCAKSEPDASAVADSSQRARVVLTSTVDTTGGAKKSPAYAHHRDGEAVSLIAFKSVAVRLA
jgi:hypothetical protein